MRTDNNNLRMYLKTALDNLWARVQGLIATIDEKIDDISTSAITEETDPTVPAWAKQSTKPTYTAAEVGALSTSDVANNLTTTAAGKVLDARQGKALSDSLNSKADASAIPQNTSDLTNDGNGTSRFATMNDLPAMPTVPTKTSDLNNDGDDGASRYIKASEAVTGIRPYAYWAEGYKRGDVTIDALSIGLYIASYAFSAFTLTPDETVNLKVGELSVAAGSAYEHFIVAATGLDISTSYLNMLYVDASVYTVRTTNAIEVYLQVHNRSTANATISGTVRVIYDGYFE